MTKLLGLPDDLLKRPPEEFLDVFVAPAMREIADNPAERKRYVQFLRKTLGEAKYKQFMYDMAVENTPNMTPFKARMIHNQIFGRPKRWRLRR